MTAPVELYVRQGSRFVRADDARPVPPIPTPVPVPDVDVEGIPTDWRTDPANPHRTLVPAAKCSHGHFARFAARHCCAPRGTR